MKDEDNNFLIKLNITINYIIYKYKNFIIMLKLKQKAINYFLLLFYIFNSALNVYIWAWTRIA